MSTAGNGDTVKVHYTGKLDGGSVFDSSVGREPLQFMLGKGQLIPGFENAVIGMEKGEKKTVNVPAGEAYGQRKDDLMITVERTKVPDNIKPEPGLAVQIPQQDGSSINMVITGVNDENIVLDANHPLSGKDLTFEIELVEIA
ncbi:FKBP-type peptidyl-prolyl cis-trans isomerase SlyD [bacterium BMS3Abin07]|nr:FKBP-type peptidyl-prolyl cis-trans isomerase SlyD [bacterium BMS3Abin07]GBE32441.1 FKBP-type peptidyl-prolyl cis-trans isomerase SlyD [bacterium BMS3Bbin05]HDL20133.1 peptidylprolyl isomerase [Nitrospirota bacterium]HDO23152.1 peptidylprolyl isomerase [Nitrospirota bacterium]HDZ87769.1 peptidylprolyl isomerase [Nitrospirota bacterium]